MFDQNLLAFCSPDNAFYAKIELVIKQEYRQTSGRVRIRTEIGQ